MKLGKISTKPSKKQLIYSITKKMYQKISKFLQKFLQKNTIFKYGFNLSPMYRRTTGKIKAVSPDLLSVVVEIPINYKNKNYVGAIFGGSLFGATDPIFMIQLLHILNEKYVVWDKAACIKYKAPAREKVFAKFEFTLEEIKTIKERITTEHEINIIKNLNITTQNNLIIAELSKTIYIASKQYYKQKNELRKNKRTPNNLK